MHQLRLFSIAILAALALSPVGCGGSGEKYYIPADHQIRPFTAPDPDEMAGDEDEELEEDANEAPEAAMPADEATPAAAAAPAAAPASGHSAAKPAKTGARSKSKAGSGSQ
jgi:hypothetical protein